MFFLKIIQKRIWWLGLLLLLLAFFLPNLTEPWLAFYREAMAYMGMLLLYGSVCCRPLPKRAGGFMYLCLLIMALVWAQYGFGLFAFYSTGLMVSLVLVGLLLAWQCGVVMQPGEMVFLVGLVLLAALLSAVIGFMQWFGYADIFGVFTMITNPGERMVANMAQPNHLAALLCMGMAAALYLCYRHYLALFSLAAILIFLCMALVLTESKAGMLSMLSMWFFYLFLLWRLRGQCKNGWQAWGVYSGCVLLAVVFFAWLPEIKHHWWDMGAAFTERQLTGTVNTRLIIYQQALYAIQERPIWGYGWLNTMLALKQGALHVAGFEPATYAHNLILDLLIWNGVFVGGVITLLLFYWLVKYFVYKVNPQTMFICMMVVPFVVASLTEFLFAFTYFSFLAVILCGYVFQKSAPVNANIDNGILKQNRTWHWRLHYSMVLSACAMLLGAAVFAAYVHTEKQFYLARLTLNRVYLPEPYQYKPTYILNQLDAFLRVSSIKPHKDMPDDEILLLQQTSDTLPSAMVQYYYLLALALNGHHAEYARELKALSNIRTPEFNREVLWKIEQNPDISNEIKNTTKLILKNKV